MNYIKISLGIFLVLASSRLIPHPPNFTSLMALSFYIPAILGLRFVPALLVSFAITDLIIGLHSSVFFTWGSVILIALISPYFKDTILKRIFGALTGAVIFFIVTNFGVWFGGMYSQNINGLMESYIMGLPFFGYSFISTFLFSAVVESIIKFKKFNLRYFN
tara:strand:- start:376 stop:861 length:486 start_codon:yes stop_codon:yes gene_type:complete